MRNKSKWMMLAGAMALALEAAPALGQAPVIASFGRNGELVCTNLQPGSTASVEWATSAAGPWTNSWAGLDVVPVNSNGMIRVSVPMFYRVRGVPVAPAGMALIPAGSFTMGDNLDGLGYALPVHLVAVSAFYMDQYEVTKALWDSVKTWATANGYNFDNRDSGKALNHPAHSVSWYSAVKWCNARSQREGRIPAYYTDAALTQVYTTGEVVPHVNWNAGYRLPTEAEWEKAARGGASGHRFPWNDVDTITHSRANYSSSTNYAYDLSQTRGFHPSFNSGGYPYTSPVGHFAPNGYGLYDMAGNVWEWCWGWYGDYSDASQTDPRGPASGVGHVFRGGSWGGWAMGYRVAFRSPSGVPMEGDFGVGFRSVLPTIN